MILKSIHAWVIHVPETEEMLSPIMNVFLFGLRLLTKFEGIS